MSDNNFITIAFKGNNFTNTNDDEKIESKAEIEEELVLPVKKEKAYLDHTAKTGEKIKAFLTSLVIPLILLILWQLLSSLGIINKIILPSPINVFHGLIDMIQDGSLAIDLRTSGYRVLIGYAWGAGIGLVLGIASGLSKLCERLIGPIVDILRQIPLYAWIPLFILWFGIGELSKEVIIAKSVFVPVYINTLQGIRGVSAHYVEVSRVLELRFVKALTKVILPSSLPSVFTGLRLGAGNAWMSVVAAEMLGGLTGLGYALVCAQDFLQPERLIALMAVIGLIGFIIDRLIRLSERSVLHWRKGFEGAGK